MRIWTRWQSFWSHLGALLACEQTDARRGRALRLETLEDRCLLSGVQGDFNGDGYADLVVGIPNENVGAFVDAGAVNVIYGSEILGLDAINGPGNQQFDQDALGILDAAEDGDHFGAAVAVGDFNGDGFDDVAIGAPDEDLGAGNTLIQDAGVVHVIYGSANGLSHSAASGNQLFSQDTPGVKNQAEANDRFGAVLAAGDFNHDGYADLAIGIPNEDIRTQRDAGAVQILFGSATGLTVSDQFLAQNTPGIKDPAEKGDHFGAALAVGDFNNDGMDDLAIGVPDEDVGRARDAGAVNLLYGSFQGLTVTGDQFWTQNSGGVAGAAESGDHFGAALAAGDFNHDGRDDLAIGVPQEDLGAVVDAGGVNVLYGGTNRLTAVGSQFFDQDTADMVDTAQAGDRFGASLTAVPTAFAGYDGLAIGVPGEDANAVVDSGAVQVVFGSAAGLAPDAGPGNQLLHQDTPGMAGDTGEVGDAFGTTLTAGVFDASGFTSLVIGTPLEDSGLVVNAGAVTVIRGSAPGLTTVGSQFFLQGFGGILGIGEDEDQFGAAL